MRNFFNNLKMKCQAFWKMLFANRRNKLVTLSSLFLILVLIVGGIILEIKHRQNSAAKTVVVASSTPTPTPTPSSTPTPVTTPDILTGLPVSLTQAQDPVAAVMIENLDPDARPQSGLGDAGMVYETLAEGGITRFMALFQEPFPNSIGPVRSLRPYFLEWGLEHDIPVVHAGGSQPALAEVSTSGLKNIDALGSDGSYFTRTTDRVAPHNLYISGSSLASLLTSHGYDTAPTFTPLPRKADAPETNPQNPTINIDFSSGGYAVKYVYDSSGNAYDRFMGGSPHVDQNTGKQIVVKNVVVQFVNVTYGTQPDGKPETDIQDVGSGRLLVFMDGGMITGTWNKASASSQTQFLDNNNQPIQFNAGNTWVSVVPNGNSVTY